MIMDDVGEGYGEGGGGGGGNQRRDLSFLPDCSTSSRTLRRLALASVAIVGSRLFIVPLIFFAL